MARGLSGARRVHLINAQRHAIIDELKRRSSDGENAAVDDLDARNWERT